MNPVGIQYLSEGLQRQVFPLSNSTLKTKKKNASIIKLSQKHLEIHELLGKKTAINDPIDFKIPQLQGKTLDEHFYKIGLLDSQKYLDLANQLIHIGGNVPQRPKKWKFQSGWTRYLKGKRPEKVNFPLEDSLVFDVENLYKLSPYPVMATCVSEKAWYGWVSPYLTKESPTNNHLIPMNTFGNEKIIVGHNVSFDRARILEEYNLKQSNAFFIDTMSLHIAVSGMCSRQRGTWLKYKKSKEDKLKDLDETDLEKIRLDNLQSDEVSKLLDNPVLDLEGDSSSQDLQDDPWMKFSSMNSLKNVADLHCGIKMQKEDRDILATEDMQELVDKFQQLMDYCARDVDATFKVFIKIFPEFRELVPHPVSFGALRYIAQSFLPTSKKWENYINTAEKIYVESTSKIEKNLHEMANEIVELRNNPKRPWETDPWLSQLDWTTLPVKLTKKGEPYKNQKLPGYPEWYKSLVVKDKLKLTTRNRIAPLLLKLQWDSNPLFWTDTFGWCFVAPASKLKEYEDQNYIHITPAKLSSDPKFDTLSDDMLYKKCILKVPHNDGPNARVVGLMTKSFLSHFEKGLLTSEFELAKDALQLAVSCSYWTSARERIMNQMVLYNDDSPNLDFGTKDSLGMIIPQIVPMGTITRRAVENTWLTASNAKKTRLGSELKSMISAPPGYCFVGADVDSEELWIASVVGDSVFKTHGGTAIGWMTLEGNKSEGTEYHSRTASILGISRNEAKIFNYGRIYGAGLKFATTLLKKFNPFLTDKDASSIAKRLYSETKGMTGRFNDSKIWYGGSESIVFNRLERIAEQESPRTPALGAGITAALTKKNLLLNSFLPSRINWAIQSSGVDYLHLLIISMEYLTKTYNIDARLFLTVHDEIRYLVKAEDKYKAAMILQISNLWTRAMFSSQLGMDDVPQSCAFFSAVDIDHVLRKEVDLDCVTPSNPVPIPSGESIDINQLLEKEGMRELFETVCREVDVSHIPYTAPKPAIEALDSELDSLSKELLIEMQIVKDEKKFKTIRSDFKRAVNTAKQDVQRAIFEREQRELKVVEPEMEEEISVSHQDIQELIGEISETQILVEEAPVAPVKKKRKSSKKAKSPGVRYLRKMLKESSNRDYHQKQKVEEEPKVDVKVMEDLSVTELLEVFRR